LSLGKKKCAVSHIISSIIHIIHIILKIDSIGLIFGQYNEGVPKFQINLENNKDILTWSIFSVLKNVDKKQDIFFALYAFFAACCICILYSLLFK